MDLNLDDIYIGHTDARNEVSLLAEHELQGLDDCFVVPPTLSLKSFMKGQKFFLTGMKGTGKTATLHHLARKLSQSSGSASHFVYFKSDLSSDDLARLSKIAHSTITSVDAQDYPSADFQPAWRWFLYRQLVRISERQKMCPARDDSAWGKFSSWMKAPAVDDDASGFHRFIPKMVRGAVTIAKDPKLELSAEWDFQGKAKISFEKLIAQADAHFHALSAGGDTIYIFIDELELRRSTQKQYERDARLIGDLILAVSEFNRDAKAIGIGVRVYAAVRSEVMAIVTSSGREINKVVEDLGTRIVWDPSGVDSIAHPLLQVILKRIRFGTQNSFQHLDDAGLWQRMFPHEVDRESSEKYILHRSWFRPRDMIRRLNIAKESYPSADRFSSAVLVGSSKEYSRYSWFEMQEELAASYSADEIQAIASVLTGISRSFSFREFANRVDDISAQDPRVSELRQKRKIYDVVTDLYRVGVLGNLVQREGLASRPRYAFRGDQTLLANEQICVHKALRQHLSIT